MSKIWNWYKELWQGFIDWIIDILIIILTFFKDLSLTLFELLLQGVVFSFSTLQPPEFIVTGLQSITAALPPSVIYFLGQSGLSEGLSMLGAAYTFRLLRKTASLGFWK
ncbi:DUF2523 family protein [Alishewanella longhuensis]